MDRTDKREKTTFMMDFGIADRFGVKAVKDTYKRAFEEWKSNYKYFTELVMVLNHRCWYWYEKGNTEFSELYSQLYYKARAYAISNYKGEELRFYLEVTD